MLALKQTPVSKLGNGLFDLDLVEAKLGGQGGGGPFAGPDRGGK